uniref:Uncharacterized protein n=1 Tax=Paramormyrops kingsleyae TaxID=1676925 RepID=A0A3B3SUJ1_9TELE
HRQIADSLPAVYDLKDRTIKFMRRRATITLDDDSETLRVEILLDNGQYKFTCPALKDGGNQKCGKEWPYQEVRKMAVLTDRISLCLAYMKCPGCQSSVEQEDLTNLSVHCTCLKQWKGPGPQSNSCNNKGCTNKDLDLLQKCLTIVLPEVQNVQCPSIRFVLLLLLQLCFGELPVSIVWVVGLVCDSSGQDVVSVIRKPPV